MKRRSFLLAATSLGLPLTAAGRVFAQTDTFNANQSAILAQVVRDLFPHPSWNDTPYDIAVAGLTAMSAEPGLRSLMQSGLDGLGVAYVDMPADRRVRQLKLMQSTLFFQTVRLLTIFNLYGNPASWPYLGYEGPSYEEGGYLFRGFDDISWLPKPDGDLYP